jgi:hypothetical protein
MRDPMPNEPLDDAERELQALAENIDVEEQRAAAAMAQLAIDGEVDLESEKDDDTIGLTNWPFYRLPSAQNWRRTFGL